jgi:hypothetical protein
MIQYETQCAASVRRTQPQFHPSLASTAMRHAACFWRVWTQQLYDCMSGSGSLTQEIIL